MMKNHPLRHINFPVVIDTWCNIQLDILRKKYLPTVRCSLVSILTTLRTLLGVSLLATSLLTLTHPSKAAIVWSGNNSSNWLDNANWLQGWLPLSMMMPGSGYRAFLILIFFLLLRLGTILIWGQQVHSMLEWVAQDF